MKVFRLKQIKPQKIPLLTEKISAGFPSPAQDYFTKRLSLDELMITHPDATYFSKIEGDSMEGEIKHGDLVVIDRQLTPKHGNIIIAVINNEFTIKRLIKKEGIQFLESENPNYATIEITDDTQFEMWGVVTHCIHQL